MGNQMKTTKLYAIYDVVIFGVTMAQHLAGC